MALPKLDVPSFELILPSTGKKILLRQYLVKEQKILLMAQFSQEEKDIVDAIKQIINNCLLTENVDVDKLAMFDIEYIFLKLRSRSVAESIELSYKCTNQNYNGKPCTGVFSHKLNIDELVVTKNENNNNVVILDESRKIGITLRYPTYEVFTKYVGIENKDTLSQIFSVVKDCTQNIFYGDEVHEQFDEKEFFEFLDQMTEAQFTKITKFFETLPKLYYKIDFKCPTCGLEEHIELRTLSDFFV